MNEERHPHLSEERIQEFLDDQLPDAARPRVEGHLADCSRCRDAVASWRALFRRLEELPELTPSAAFRERILDALPEGRSVWSRILDRFRPVAPADAAGGRHPAPELVLDYLEGALPVRARSRLEGHLEGCGACREEVGRWREVFAALEALPVLEPSPGFADAVMARVPVEERSRAPAATDALDRVLGWLRGLQWPRALRPRSVGQWALAAAAAAAPIAALTAGSLALFSHPQLTPGYLAAFLWWQVSEAVGALAGAAWNGLTESALVFRAYSIVDGLGGSPELLGIAAFALAAGTVASLWVLYRNLITTSGVDRHYAKLSA